jgi:triosephosphate isomerase
VRRALVAGNWKMNGSSAFAAKLIPELTRTWSPDGPEMAVFPPAPYVREVRELIGTAGIAVGLQNVHAEATGAFTGEVAAEMANDAGAQCALVGHSERRVLFGETDADVAAKFVAIQRAGLMPVVCVGEQLAEREAGAAESTVLAQLDAVLSVSGIAAFADAVVAYEPVWAIGTGRTAEPEDAQRPWRKECASSTVAASMRATPPPCSPSPTSTAASSAVRPSTPSSSWRSTRPRVEQLERDTA